MKNRPFVVISLVLVVLTSLYLASCSHTPIVSDFREAPGALLKGVVTPLSTAIEGNSKTIVVLIHGVGDHCPGYALIPEGWLNNSTARSFGFMYVDKSLKDAVPIEDTEFLPGKRRDENSKVSYREADFTYRGANIHAIEITWSQLTQWVKTQQLGYDITDPPKGAPGESTNCFYTIPPSMDFPYSKPPPDRVAVNGLVKEQVFDRSLVDTIIYVGDYGAVIQRGVAEALCRALGGTSHTDSNHVPDGGLCDWPSKEKVAPAGTGFIFVTHSLGGRIVYDTLLGLTGDRVNPERKIFSDDGEMSEVGRSRDVVCRIIGRTSAIYMMANQLTLLGLAYDDATHISADGPQSYDLSNELPVRGCGKHSVASDAQAARIPPDRHDIAPIMNTFAQIWQRAKEEEATPKEVKLSIVAFNDTNDLLTWGIPRWYAAPTAGIDVPLQVTNVYVKNDTHWLGVVENPSTAHVGYFKNSEVWSVITCGAGTSRLESCK